MNPKIDCKYFKGYMPCIYHKLENYTCDNCKHYRPIKTKILIIKLDAIGDVLRTTCILPALRKKYPNCHITWITKKEAFPILFNNHYIDRVLEYGTDVLARLFIEKFHIAINPSNDNQSAALASLAKAEKKFGYSLNKNGTLHPLDDKSEYYFNMGIDDNIKRMNKMTYQQLIFEMLGLLYKGNKPVLKLNPDEINIAEIFAKKNNLKSKDLVIGLNTGAGERWELKKWSVEKTSKLAEYIHHELKAKIILFGGNQEFERNQLILSKCKGPLIDAGCKNSLREFAALINLTDILITSDSLALHIATALDKQIVGLFGPTSFNEIELYGKGKKVFANMDCLCCYKQRCDKKPNCMDNISVEQVFKSIKNLLSS